MVSDKTIYKAFRIHKILFKQIPIRESIFNIFTCNQYYTLALKAV